jgi:hypothetical protein
MTQKKGLFRISRNSPGSLDGASFGASGMERCREDGVDENAERKARRRRIAG